MGEGQQPLLILVLRRTSRFLGGGAIFLLWGWWCPPHQKVIKLLLTNEKFGDASVRTDRQADRGQTHTLLLLSKDLNKKHYVEKFSLNKPTNYIYVNE